MGADRLEQRLEVENAGREPLRFTTALHTYFAVASIHEVPPFMQRPGGRAGGRASLLGVGRGGSLRLGR